MRADGVVVPSPGFDQDLRLLQRVEDLAVEQLVAELGVEALDVAVLPGGAGLDVGGLRADGGDPVPQGPGQELRAVVRADVRRRAAREHELRQGLDDGGRVQLAVDPDRQRLASELVDDGQHPELAPVVRPVLDEVVGPDVVRPLRPQPDAGSVIEPKPALLRLFPWHLQPLAPPDPLDPLLVHGPARLVQERRDPAVAVAAVGRRQLDDVRRQLRLVVCRHRHPTLR